MDPYFVAFFVVTLCVLAIGFHHLGRQMTELHLSMNSRLDQLIQKTSELARAEGFRAGEKHHLVNLRDAGSSLEKK